METTRIIRTRAELNTFVEEVLSSPDTLLAVDCETEEFNEKENKTLAMDLALYGVGYYLNEKVHAYILYGTPGFKELQKIMDAKECVFHNAKFDLTILYRHGFDVHDLKIHDTMIMSWLENDDKRAHGLKQLARTLLKREKVTEYKNVGARPKPLGGLFPEEDKEAITKWEETMGLYCVEDCLNTHDLFYFFKKSLDKQDPLLWKVYTQLEIPFIFVLMDMEKRGIRVDVGYLIQKEAEIDKSIYELTIKIREMAGYKEVTKITWENHDLLKQKKLNIDSPQQIRELFTKLEVKIPSKFITKTGLVSTNEATLTYLAEHGTKIAQLILDYRELVKIRNTYLVGLREIQRDGVVYSSFKQIGTHTGRLSSSQPNLQQLPRRSDTWNIRSAFKPREGYVFVMSDFSQIELRVAAYYAQDPIMCKALQERPDEEKGTGDIHQATADALGLGCKTKCAGLPKKCKECKEGRSRAKTVNFGLLYGLSSFGLAARLNIGVEEAEAFLNHYFKQFPSLKVFIEKVTEFMKKNKYIRTITRRRRHFKNYNRMPIPAGVKFADLPEIERELLNKERIRLNRSMERQATNSVIQGSAADITKIAMRNIHIKLKAYDSHILVQIHDELIVEVPIGKEQEVMRLVQYEMEHAVTLKNVPIYTDPQISSEWKK